MLSLFSSDGFMPHGHCYLWKPGLIWLHVLSDALIALAYLSIPFTLLYFVRRRRDLPFHWMFVCFALFIISCGATHVMEIWTLWTPTYWLSGAIKALTAAASLPTAILLVKLVPQAMAIPAPSELAKANEELKSIENELRVANRELEAFSYSVAHDLRGPLRGMNGFAQALLEDYPDKLDHAGVEYLQRIQVNAVRMGESIDGLLSLARVTRYDLHPEPIDITKLARSTAASLAIVEPRRTVELVIQEGMEGSLDPALGRALFDNLIGNAWKFTSKTSAARIEVGMLEKERGQTFFVRDNGPGFDMAHAGQLFTSFHRLHGRDYPGTGIGLATCRRIVERHGGRLWAEAAVGRGATFYVDLPMSVQGRGGKHEQADPVGRGQ